MQAPFRLFGAEQSAFSHKVRSFLRYKGLEHEWIVRTNANAEAFAQVARLPLTPVLIEADGRSLQDSSLILEKVEAAHPEPSATPAEAALAFSAQLLEDYGDEWLNKIVFYYRWGRDEDLEVSSAQAIAAIYPNGDAPDGAVAAMAERMSAKRGVIGATAENAATLEASLRRFLELVEPRLAGRAYLFGGTPSFGDFGLAAQVQQLLTTPAGGTIVRASAPNIAAWAERMAAPERVGAFEPFDDALGFLQAFFRSETVGAHLAWLAANAAALQAGERSVSIWVDGRPYAQGVQKYAGKAFQELRRKRAFKAEDAALAALLGEAGCDEALKPPTLATPVTAITEGAGDDDARADDHGADDDASADQDVHAAEDADA